MADRNFLYVSAGEVVSATTGDTVALAHGGTGQTTANDSLNALLPSQGGNSGKFLKTDGSNSSWASVSGSGTVTSVDVSGGTTGLTTSGGPVTTSGTITLAGTLAVANGGTGQTTALAARGSSGLNVESATGHGDSNYTIVATDRFVYTTAAFTAARTWTLPAASAVNAGGSIVLADLANGVSSGFVLIVARAGSDLIYGLDGTGNDNGASSAVVLTGPGGKAELTSDGTSKWFVRSLQGVNSGTNTGDQTITLTGNVTGSGTGSFATTLASGNAGNLDSGTLLAARMPALTGDVTTSAGAVATTIGSNAVTYAKFVQPAAASLVGNMTGSAANATDVPLGTGLKFENSTLQALGVLVAQFRPTLESGVPVSTTDQTGKTTLYLTPYNGNRLPAYDGTYWQFYQYPEFGISLGTLTSGKNYDAWAFVSTATPSSTNTSTDVVTFGSATGWGTGSIVRAAATAGGLTAGTDYFYNANSSTTGTFHTTLANALAGTPKVDLTANVTQALTAASMELLAWSSDSARATGIVEQNGVWVKSGDATRRLVATIRTTSTTTTEDSAAKRFVGGVDFPVPRRLFTCPGYVDDNANTTYSVTVTSFGDANGGTGNKCEFVAALSGVYADILCQGQGSIPSGSMQVGIGQDTSSTAKVYGVIAVSGTLNVTCRRGDHFAAGYHYFALIARVSTGTGTLVADSARLGGTSDPATTYLEGFYQS